MQETHHSVVFFEKKIEFELTNLLFCAGVLYLYNALDINDTIQTTKESKVI